jgi:hypothetical protein
MDPLFPCVKPFNGPGACPNNRPKATKRIWSFGISVMDGIIVRMWLLIPKFKKCMVRRCPGWSRENEAPAVSCFNKFEAFK